MRMQAIQRLRRFPPEAFYELARKDKGKGLGCSRTSVTLGNHEKWGAEVRPRFSHVLSKMDRNGFKVLTSSEPIRSEIEFPSVGSHGLPDEV